MLAFLYTLMHTNFVPTIHLVARNVVNLTNVR